MKLPRDALAPSRTNAAEARKLRNPAVAPRLEFLGLSGQGYMGWSRDPTNMYTAAAPRGGMGGMGGMGGTDM